MKQMEVDASQIVRMNYDSDNLPAAVREFRPLVFQEGDLFCCVLGPDPQIGVFGCGPTTEEAIKDWNEDFKRRVKDRRSHNEVTQYIQHMMAAHRKDA